MQPDNTSQSRSMTRSEATEELIKRGYTKDEYPGIWRTPDGKDKIVWFLATKLEGLSFDSKSWGPEIAACKERWRNRKKMCKI